MTNISKLQGILGLTKKSGNLLSGENNCISAIKSGKVLLVIVANDASENTKKLFRDKCTYRNIPVYYILDKDKLGKIIGKESRAVFAVTDKGFKDLIMKNIEEI